MAAEPAPETRPASTSPQPPSDHLSPEELYELVEDRLSRRKLKVLEAHLADCADCVETLAMVLRAERPASREEEEILAKASELSDAELLSRLRPNIAASAPGTSFEWKPIIVSAVLAALILAGGSIVRTRLWLPEASRRAAVAAFPDTASQGEYARQASFGLPVVSNEPFCTQSLLCVKPKTLIWP